MVHNYKLMSSVDINSNFCIWIPIKTIANTVTAIVLTLPHNFQSNMSITEILTTIKIPTIVNH